MTIRFLARATAAPALLVASSLLGRPAHGQTIADRVATARDGEVRMAYAARPGACGDGRDVVAFGRALYVYRSFESYGRWSGVTCVPGPVRVTLAVRGREVTAARVRVGAAGPSTEGGAVTDLGTVAAGAAAEYFVGLAQRADAPVAKEAVLAAALADSATVAPALLRVAKDDGRASAVRRRAVQWAGEIGGAAVVPELDAIARRDGVDREVRESALVGLAHAGDGAGIATLVRYVRSGDDAWLQKKAVFWLGQSESREAHATLRDIIDSTSAPDELRSAAVFALGHGEGVTADDITFLQRAYGRTTSDEVKEKVLMAVARHEGGARWALDRARDEREPLEARRKAAFWAGQGGASVADLVALYRAVRPPSLKEHLLFVLSQRDERAATDELLAVARSDADPAMRKKAMFWLGQKDDPRVAQLIRDIVTH